MVGTSHNNTHRPEDEAMGESAIGSGAEDYLIKGDVTPHAFAIDTNAIERKKME